MAFKKYFMVDWSLKLHKAMKKRITRNLRVITIEKSDTDRQARVRPSMLHNKSLKLKKNAGVLQLRAHAALPESSGLEYQ